MDILFVTATRIGDAVLSTGLLSDLIEHHPEARLTIAAGPDAAPLFEAVPGLERLLVVAKRRWSLHWLPLYAAVAARRWDLVVDLRGSALAWLLRAAERKVMAKGDSREHRVRQLGRLFDLDPPPGPRLWTGPHHEAAAGLLIPPGGPVLAVGPAANWRGKQWRAERFAELARRLTAPDGALPGARVAVLAAGHERGQAAAAARRNTGSAAHRSGRPDRPADRGGSAAALCAVRRQRHRADAHRRGDRHADPGPLRSEPDRAIRAVGLVHRRGAHRPGAGDDVYGRASTTLPPTR